MRALRASCSGLAYGALTLLGIGRKQLTLVSAIQKGHGAHRFCDTGVA